MLEHTTDIYDGVNVDETGLPDNMEEFTSLLEASLNAWRSTGKKGVWLKVNLTAAVTDRRPVGHETEL